jgi:hypothetical protein
MKYAFEIGSGVMMYIYLSMAVQPFVGSWQIFQFLNPIHSR